MTGRQYIIYDSYAKNRECKEKAESLIMVYENTIIIDIEKISNYAMFFSGFEENDEVIICGGDRTLNRFVNAVQELDIKNNIYFYAVGNGCDFVRDFGREMGKKPDFLLNPYMKKLPTLVVRGKEQLFLNGVGYGFDSYCWEEQENIYKKKARENQIKRNLRLLKAAIFHYQPVGASVSVDEREYIFEKVWMAPAMNGRFYNGGLMPTPKQDRTCEGSQLSLMVMHDCSRWKAFFIYLAMYKGRHEKYKKNISILCGKEVKVAYDRPKSLKVDGEVIHDITEYSARI